MLKHFLIAAPLCLSLIACAETPNKSPTALHANTDWKSMTYRDWDKTLHISNKCPAKFDGHNERFVSIRELNDSTSILAISCELGAYQDGNRLYILKNGEASAVFPVLPRIDENWHLEKQEVVWGNQYKDGDYLVLENWFAGSGECGYRAFYSISNVITQKSPKPEKVYGDEDCGDGVFLDDWPLLENLK